MPLIWVQAWVGKIYRESDDHYNGGPVRHVSLGPIQWHEKDPGDVDDRLFPGQGQNYGVIAPRC